MALKYDAFSEHPVWHILQNGGILSPSHNTELRTWHAEVRQRVLDILNTDSYLDKFYKPFGIQHSGPIQEMPAALLYPVRYLIQYLREQSHTAIAVHGSMLDEFDAKVQVSVHFCLFVCFCFWLNMGQIRYGTN